MNFIKLEQFDTANGLGIGTVLWVAGCNHKCPCCHNPQTWDKNVGKHWDFHHLDYLLKSLEPEYITRFTLSGGDPLLPDNREEIAQVIQVVREHYPDKYIWLYTGYSWEEVQDLQFLKLVDVIVDGEFKIAMKDISLPYRGSSNQRIIGITDKGKNQIRGLN